jgi:hypothetical protein
MVVEYKVEQYYRISDKPIIRCYVEGKFLGSIYQLGTRYLFIFNRNTSRSKHISIRAETLGALKVKVVAYIDNNEKVLDDCCW